MSTCLFYCSRRTNISTFQAKVALISIDRPYVVDYGNCPDGTGFNALPALNALHIAGHDLRIRIYRFRIGTPPAIKRTSL